MDIFEFAKKVFNKELIPEQKQVLKDFLNNDIKHIILTCCRGFGKSLSASLLALYLASEVSTPQNPITVLLVSAQDEIYVKTDLFFRNNPELVNRLRVKGERYLMGLEEYQFKDTYGRVILKKNTSQAVRGTDVNFVIIDEAQAIDEHLITRDIIPSSKQYPNKVIMLGTPSEIGYFVDQIKDSYHKRSKSYGYWKVISYPYTVCYWLKDKAEEDRKTMSEEDFQTEYLAKIPEEESKSMFRKYMKKTISETTPDMIYTSDVYTVLGIDLGFGRTNVTALVLVERHRKSRKVRVLYTETLIGFDTERIKQIIKQKKPSIVVIDFKPIELANRIRNEVETYCKIPFKNTVGDTIKSNFVYFDATNKKKGMVNEMINLMDTNNIIISDQLEDLIKELWNFNLKKKEHRNLADALLLSCSSDVTIMQALKPEPHGIVVFPKNYMEEKEYSEY